VRRVRAAKCPYEIALMQRAADITAHGAASVLTLVKPLGGGGLGGSDGGGGGGGRARSASRGARA
jgi:hypothetical protein